MLDIGNIAAVASLDVDAQNGFTPLCPKELPVPQGAEIVHELNAQAKYACIRIGTKDAHPVTAKWVATSQNPALSPIIGDNMDVRWPVHCVPGTKGFELISGLPHPAAYDFFVWKGVEPDMHPYGGCYHDLKETLSTGMIEFLRSRSITTIIIGGLATDYCVKATTLQLLRAGFNSIVNLGACRGLEPGSIAQAIVEMRRNGAKFIHAAAELKVSI